MRWGRLLFLLALGYVGFKVEGWGGALAFVVCFLIGAWLVYTAIDFVHDVARFFNRPVERHEHYHVHGEVRPDGTYRHPDVEGTARRHPDPTRPDEEEWAGAITYRLEKGTWK